MSGLDLGLWWHVQEGLHIGDLYGGGSGSLRNWGGEGKQLVA